MKTRYKVNGENLEKIEVVKAVKITYYNPVTKSLENVEKTFDFDTATEHLNEFKKGLAENGFKIVEIVKENVKRRIVIPIAFINWENSTVYTDEMSESDD